MRTRLLLLTAASLTALGLPALGQTPGLLPGAEEVKDGSAFCTVFQPPRGNLVLRVEYPWKVYQNPSIEVRLVTGENADPAGIRALAFVKRYLKGDVAADVYRAADAAEQADVAKAFTKDDIDFEILARRNTLGKPAVCVARAVPKDDPTPGAGAAFCFLPSWSINEGLLYLDLPPEYFAEAGKLHIWLLRDGDIVWAAKKDWPGYPEVREAEEE